MSGSSWKKAGKTGQKVHRERKQPASRAHLGLLEKKKDYKLRAKDYHKKEAALRYLKRRALERNPDEYYFHMINSRVEDGIHHEPDKAEEHTPEQVRLMQTQDLRYIVHKRSIETHKIERLKSHLHMLDVKDGPCNTHTFFVDSEKEARNFDVAKHLDTHPALLDRACNRPKLSDLKRMNLKAQVDGKKVKSLESQRQKAYGELQKRIEREKQLLVVQQKLEVKRHLQDKKAPPPKRVQGGTTTSAPIYQWKYERKR